MKVLLVNPMPAGLMRVSPPMGLGYVGASLKRAGNEVLVYDETLKSVATLREVLINFRPSIVGITGLSSQYPSVKRVARSAKEIGSTVVVGGIHASSYPEFTLSDCKNIDYVIKGEGEKSFVDFLDGRDISKIPGLYYRNHNGVKGKYPELIDNLDSLSPPWDVLHPKDYVTSKPAGVVSRQSIIAPLLTSRGCPYGCTYCCASVVQGKRIRLRSVGNILDEIEYLVNRCGIKEIQIIDDNFSFYPEHILGVCRGIKDRSLRLDWTVTNGIRADRVNKDILKEMRSSGCYYFAIGIESGSSKILKDISKGLSLDRVRETTKEADKLGFITQGFFMMGFPGETSEDWRQSSDFAAELKLDRIAVAPVMALPGSKLFDTQFGGDVSSYDWTQSGIKGWKPVPGAADYSTIKRSINRMRLKFYLNPIRNIRHVGKVRTWHQLRGMFSGFRGLFEY